MPKGALTLEKEYKSTIEREVAAQLTKAGIVFDYEGLVIKFTIPAFEAKYNPDFPLCPIIIEAKGRFGHRGNGGAEVRQRLILVKEQHPEYDFRIIFDKRGKRSAADLPIYKGSKTTQGKWATDHGFKWASGTVPASWIAEIKANQTTNGDKHVGDGTVASKPRKRS
jgi:Phage endonuclease I